MLCFREMRLFVFICLGLMVGIGVRWWFWSGPGKAEVTWASPPMEPVAPDTPSDSPPDVWPEPRMAQSDKANSPKEESVHAPEESMPAAGDGDLADEPTAPSQDQPVATCTDGRLDINVADMQQLQSLPGIGPVLAQAIVDERTRRGRFAVLTDLLNVKGIGQTRFDRLVPYVCIAQP